jgi:succinoglycan biosynthesis protein ExoM
MKEPAWLKVNGGKPRQHGQVLERAATNNTLVDLRWLAAQPEPLRFDERLRYTGGSDTEFFHRLVKSGGVIKWVSDAEVTEEVPAARMTMRWQVNRKTRTQANNVQLYRIHNGFAHAAARYVPAALRRIILRGVPSCAAAMVLRPISKQRSDQIWFYGRRTIGSGVGALCGLFGRELEPYRVIEGE